MQTNKIKKQRRNRHRTRASGLAVVFLSLLMVAWLVIEALISGEGININDIFLLLYMVAVLLIGAVVIYADFQRRFLVELADWQVKLFKNNIYIPWPFLEPALQEIGSQITSLYTEDIPWELSAFLPGMYESFGSEVSKKQRFLNVSSDSYVIRGGQEERIKILLKRDGFNKTGLKKLYKKRKHEGFAFLGRSGEVSLGLVAEIPDEPLLRGGKWTKELKLKAIQRAVGICVHRMASIHEVRERTLQSVETEDIGMILRMMSHEVTNSLMVVMSSKGLSEVERDELARSVQIIWQLNNITSLRDGFFESLEGSTVLMPIIRKTVLGVQGQWPSTESILHSEVDENLLVIGDWNISSVFQNVIFNAFSHSKSEVKVDVSLDESESWVLTKVYDDGTGVPYEMKDWIFNILTNLSGTKHRPLGGGIGLYVARKISREIGGDVYLGVPDKGETTSNHFVIKLKVDRSFL